MRQILNPNFWALEIVEAVAGPDGEFAQRVALIQLEIHVESNKLAPTTNSDQKKDPTHGRLDMCFEWMPSSSWLLSSDFACAAHTTSPALQLYILLKLDVDQVWLHTI